jgi:cobalt/nickel transport system permease protein
MHISEGIITGAPAAAYTALALGLVAVGAKKMKDFVKENPEKKSMLGMAGAFIFFLSLIPIPAFTGTCSHPCGSPLIGILLGPWIGIALTGLTLFLQAAFFAHGGFSTWGANLITLGVGGAFFGWLAFKIARQLKLPLAVAAAIGGLVGDIMTYAFAGLSLSAVLSASPEAQFPFGGYLAAIYAAYLPTQGPIALGEMLLTGWLVFYIHRERADILISLKVIKKAAAVACIVAAIIITTGIKLQARDSDQVTDHKSSRVVTNTIEEKTEEGMAGMDEAVNEHYAEDAGRAARDPYLNFEALGDVWNAIMLLAGGICGYIIGRGRERYFGKKA